MAANDQREEVRGLNKKASLPGRRENQREMKKYERQTGRDGAHSIDVSELKMGRHKAADGVGRDRGRNRESQSLEGGISGGEERLTGG